MTDTKEILSKFKSIALVGASKDLTKTSSIVMKYLQDYGFKVYPVNPSMKGQKLLGETVFGNIKEIKSAVEIIDVFRPSDEVTEIAQDAVKIGAKVLWGQIGVVNHEAARLAENAGLKVVMDRCPKIELFRPFWKPRLDLEL